MTGDLPAINSGFDILCVMLFVDSTMRSLTFDSADHMPDIGKPNPPSQCRSDKAVFSIDWIDSPRPRLAAPEARETLAIRTL